MTINTSRSELELEGCWLNDGQTSQSFQIPYLAEGCVYVKIRNKSNETITIEKLVLRLKVEHENKLGRIHQRVLLARAEYPMKATIAALVLYDGLDGVILKKMEYLIYLLSKVDKCLSLARDM